MAKFNFLLVNEKTLQIFRGLKTSKHFNNLWSEIGGSSNTLKKYVDELVDGGYIKEEREGKFPYKRTLTLTKKGKDTLKLMEEIMGIR